MTRFEIARAFFAGTIPELLGSPQQQRGVAGEAYFGIIPQQ